MAKIQINGAWGYDVTSTASAITTFALNSALSGGYSAAWYAFSFIPLTGGTLSKVRVWCNAVTGTLGASDLVCDLYSSSNGNPNTSTQSSSTVTTTPTGASWVEFTGFSSSLTAGTYYWIVLRNANGTPTSNYPTYAYLSNRTTLSSAADPACGQMLVFTSTNSGGAWTRNSFSAPLFVVDYGSSVTEGVPIQAYTAADLQVYSSREAGSYFVTPADTSLNVIGVAGFVAKNATPTGNMRYRIYTGSSSSPTLAGTTGVMTPGETNTSRSLKPLYFSSPITIAGGTTVRVVLSETSQSDTSTNRYGMDTITFSSTDTGIYMPYLTQPKTTLSTDGGSTFTDTNDKMAMIWLLLDLNDPFPTAAGGGASAYTFLG